MKKLTFFFAGLLLFLNACSLIEEEILQSNVIDADITTPTTWTADKVWEIKGNINVTSDLVIEPGTTIKFNEDAELGIGYGAYGSLIAVGTADEPIIFTSNANSPSAGDYRGIVFYDKAASSSILSFCTVEYAGLSYGYDAAVYIEYSDVSITNCTIRNSATSGISVYNGGLNEFALNTIENCETYPVIVPASAVHMLDSLSSISGKGVYIYNAEMEDLSVTWQQLSIPYILNTLDINNNTELTLSPGTILKFKADGALYVGYSTYGKIIAEGTQTEPIVFTSEATNPSAGDWNGISLFEKAGDKSVFNHCVIEFAGNAYGYDAGLYLEYATVSIDNTTITQSATQGVHVYYGALKSFTNNTINNCNDYPVSVPANTVHAIDANNQIEGKGVFVNNGEFTNQTKTWNNLTVPYLLNTLDIRDDGVLTIAKGTTLLFLADGAIYVGYSSYGKLVAVGTLEEQITFSSAASSPSAGDWNGLEFYENTMSGSSLIFCTISYGGNSYGLDANVYSEYNSDKLQVMSCNITFSATCGIRTYQCEPLILLNTYSNNTDDVCTD